MPIQNDNFRIEAGKHIDDRYTKLGVPYVSVAEVNATVVISRRYKGLTVLIADKEYWYLTGINDIDLVLKTTAGGGGSTSGQYKFDVTTTAGDPGAGKLRLNTGSFFTATQIFIDAVTQQGVNIGTVLGDMATGDEIRLQLASNDDNNAVYKLTALPVDNDGWWTLAVLSKSEAGAFFADAADMVAIILLGGSETEFNVDGGTASSIYNTIPGMDGGAP